MTLRYIQLLALTVLLTVSCKEKNTQITNTEDYNRFLELETNKTIGFAKKEHEFWETKLNENPEQFPYLAQLAASESTLFQASGTIDYLKSAEENLRMLNTKAHFNNTGYIRALARNFISQHKFSEALDVLMKAEKLGESLKATQKMLFDVHLELGHMDKAKHYLDMIKDLSDFDYLIRLSKWSDHNGQLEAAINYMEKAMLIAESSGLDHLKQWTYSNIADYYGHAGDIENSYKHYLKSLEIDAKDAYALKGIAWIVYSYERNADEAMRILNTIDEFYVAPDYYLLKAEIAEFQGDDINKKLAIENYHKLISNPAYGDMYNVHTAMLNIDEHKDLEEAIQIAEHEVELRPTAQSYDLLAWAYYNNGDINEASRILNAYVLGKTFEPTAMYHAAIILKSVNDIEGLEALKKELLNSIYELGPTMEPKIQAI